MAKLMTKDESHLQSCETLDHSRRDLNDRVATDITHTPGRHSRILDDEAVDHGSIQAKPLASQVQGLVHAWNNLTLNRNVRPIEIQVLIGIRRLIFVLREVLEISLAKAAGLKTITDLSQGIGDAGHDPSFNQPTFPTKAKCSAFV
jgi:hypothetical protein